MVVIYGVRGYKSPLEIRLRQVVGVGKKLRSAFRSAGEGILQRQRPADPKISIIAIQKASETTVHHSSKQIHCNESKKKKKTKLKSKYLFIQSKKEKIIFLKTHKKFLFLF